MRQVTQDVVHFNRLAQEPQGFQPDRAQRNFIHVVEEIGEIANALPNALEQQPEAYRAAVDGCIDAIYMLVQTMLSLGLTQWDIRYAWAKVADANIDKAQPCPECRGSGTLEDSSVACIACLGLGRSMRRDPSGKIIKPQNWTPPNYYWLDVPSARTPESLLAR